MSDTVLYIAAFVVIAHFVLGILYLVYKLVGPLPDDSSAKGEKEVDSGQNQGV
ncbi:MAG: hypothetical protein R2787_08985 [Saprospiraceae bacterium]|nr:hypothetical protein [Saprospiraceae bacterium]